MANTAMSSLLNKLSGKLLEEVNLFHEAEDRVWSLVCMLKKLRPFVMEVQRKQSADIVKSMQELIELVSKADDAIDSYITTVRRPENFSASSKDEDVKLGSQIECIKWRLKIWAKRCFTSTGSSSVVEPAYDDDMVVGLENEVTRMIERLKDKNPRRDVIPIVGPGGVGKTTLAQRVYNHPTIVENFPCRAWIYAPNDDELSMKMLLQKIIDRVPSHSSNFSPPPPTTTTTAAAPAAAVAADGKDHHHREKMIILRDSAIRTYKHLKTNRYLLVFDDVFRTQFWADINMIFPDYISGGGGRIIFTTRYHEVALTARPSLPPFYLRSPLNKEESWMLFSKRVASSFRDNKASSSNSEVPVPELEPEHHPWKEWVDACGGLPLAIVTLAAEHHQRLPVDNKEDDDWDQRFPEGIWELIYNSLPHHLKPCLVYLGILNSYRFSHFKELIIAEEFVQPMWKKMIRSQLSTVEEAEDYDTTAEEYLNELISRNLVEAVSKSWNGSIKEIAIPNRFQLMNFCRDKAREEIFLQSGDSETFPQEAKRIVVEKGYRDHIARTRPVIPPLKLKAHSFLILEYPPLPWEINHMGWYWDFLIENFSSLKVLDLFGVDLNAHTIPSEIEKLCHLRYLRLNSVGGILPPSICNLWNLQFLRVKNQSTPSFQLSSEISLERFWRMKKLKRLLCGSSVLLLPQTYENSVLDNMERIKHISIRCCTRDFLSRMPNLVRLSVGGNIQQSQINETLSISLPVLKRLQKLGLQVTTTDDNPLSLQGWNVYLPNITHLTFKWTRLVGNPMRILGEKLPNLRVLKFAFNTIVGDELSFDVVDGFCQLKCLKLEEMGITGWNLSVGAMPRLEILVIKNCTSLRALPSEALQQICTLRELEVYNYSYKEVETAALAIQERVGKDQLKLRLKVRLKCWQNAAN